MQKAAFSIDKYVFDKVNIDFQIMSLKIFHFHLIQEAYIQKKNLSMN